MFIDKIVKKVVQELIIENKERLVAYIAEHKDEIIEKLKQELKEYIDAHKDEILDFAVDTIKSIAKK